MEKGKGEGRESVYGTESKKTEKVIQKPDSDNAVVQSLVKSINKWTTCSVLAFTIVFSSYLVSQGTITASSRMGHSFHQPLPGRLSMGSCII